MAQVSGTTSTAARSWRAVLSARVDAARSSGAPDRLLTALWLGLVPGAVLFAVLQGYAHWQVGSLGLDSHAYWLAARDPQSWYTLPPAYRDAYLYSPAFAQVLRPLGLLPWPAFQAVWFGAGVATLAWLLRPLGWWRGLTAGLFLCSELLLGNVYLFLAAALVLALGRVPGALALPVLTKVAPGVVALWFAARREWRPLAWVAATTLGIVSVSVALAPSAWVEWVRFLGTSAADRGTGSAVRLVVAAVVVVVAARRGWAWLLAPALVLACPVLGGYGPFAVLAAVPRLLAWQREHTADPVEDGRTDDAAGPAASTLQTHPCA